MSAPESLSGEQLLSAPKEAWCDHASTIDYEIRERGWSIEHRAIASRSCGWRYAGAWHPEYYTAEEISETPEHYRRKHLEHWAQMNYLLQLALARIADLDGPQEDAEHF